MQNDASKARKGPQLTPEIQAKIGQQLRKYYDDMVNQGVPDRFVALMDRLGAPDGNAVESADQQNDANGAGKSAQKHSSKESR
jgi:anti-sigma factor NepR-like protein